MSDDYVPLYAAENHVQNKNVLQLRIRIVTILGHGFPYCLRRISWS
jgi:hypothetical protein